MQCNDDVRRDMHGCIQVSRETTDPKTDTYLEQSTEALIGMPSLTLHLPGMLAALPTLRPAPERGRHVLEAAACTLPADGAAAFPVAYDRQARRDGERHLAAADHGRVKLRPCTAYFPPTHVCIDQQVQYYGVLRTRS